MAKAGFVKQATLENHYTWGNRWDARNMEETKTNWQRDTLGN